MVPVAVSVTAIARHWLHECTKMFSKGIVNVSKKRAVKENGKLFGRVYYGRTRINGFKLKRETSIGHKEEVFCNKGGEALAQVAPKGGGCPSPWDSQGQAGLGSERPDVAVGVCVHCRELDQAIIKGPFQLK